MRRSGRGLLALVLTIASPAWPAETMNRQPGSGDAAVRILEALEEPDLNRLVREILEHNPELRAARAKAEALAERAPQVRALPDPEAGLTAYADGPETRVGEQQWTLSLMQDLPAPGKRPLRRRHAEFEAEAALQEAEALALEQVSETLELAVDLTFHEIHRNILQELLHHLGHHEEIARSRLSTGLGGEAEVARLQVQMTEAEVEILRVETELISVQASLNRLLGRPPATPVEVAVDLAAFPAPVQGPEGPEVGELLRRHQPAIAAGRLRLEAARATAELAALEGRPDTSVGLTFTEVSGRDDASAVASPPAGNGRDILGFVGRIRLPFRRQPREAAVREADARVREAEQELRAQEADLRAVAGEAIARARHQWSRIRLLETVLVPQLEHTRRAAEAGYAAGRGEISSVLMAEHHLLDARLSIAREKAAYARSLARLWGAVGVPMVPHGAAHEHRARDSQPHQDSVGAQP